MGDVVIVRAKVNRTFSKSLEVGVLVEAENTLVCIRNLLIDFQKGEVTFLCSGYFIFVPVDKNGKTIVVPTYTPRTPEEKKVILFSICKTFQTFEDAEYRRLLRQQLKTETSKLGSGPTSDLILNFNVRLKFSHKIRKTYPSKNPLNPSQA